MKGIDFVFDCVHSLYYKCHKMNQDRNGSYVGSPDSIKNRKATISYVKKASIINIFNTLQQSY